MLNISKHESAAEKMLDEGAGREVRKRSQWVEVLAGLAAPFALHH